MILVINICKEKLHYYEFVKPILDILDSNKIKYFILGYKELKESDLEKCSKVIICGTSLYDNDFALHINKFKWIFNFDKPILGICGGMQIIGLLFGGKLKKMSEIGYYFEDFIKEFLGLSGKSEVYHLHNNYIDFSKLLEFDVFCGKEVSQAVKHKEKEIYGVLFHPEVRQKGLIVNFCKL
jgi:anthranilate/para-aminobenzoate synthase component II